MSLLGKLLSIWYCVTSMISFGSSLAIVLSASLLLSFLSWHALLRAQHLPANFNLHSLNYFLALKSTPSKMACFCWNSRSFLSNSEILSSALCFSNWKNSLSKHKSECNFEHSDVFRVRSFCSSDIDTCKTGQFSQMKLAGLAFGFGF